jgi:hypothetical protein
VPWCPLFVISSLIANHPMRERLAPGVSTKRVARFAASV